MYPIQPHKGKCGYLTASKDQKFIVVLKNVCKIFLDDLLGYVLAV